jgi:hypothetical protein
MRCYGRNFKKRSDELIKTDVGVVRDASIIASEQKVKHYEIATGYFTRLCKTLGETKLPTCNIFRAREKSRRYVNRVRIRPLIRRHLKQIAPTLEAKNLLVYYKSLSCTGFFLSN